MQELILIEQDLLWCSPSTPLNSVAHRVSKVVIKYALKLSTRCTDSRASREVQH